MKIAILGSAPSSLPLAPHHDPEWTLFGCSPGCAEGIAGKRVDEWFELHWYGLWRKDPAFPWFYEDHAYMKHLRTIPKVWMIKPYPTIPNSVEYPKLEMIKKYGPYVWTSTPAFMMTMAMERQPEEIAFFGVDMAADEEWGTQRPALQFLAWEALKRGIRVTTPPECDLLNPSLMYGYSEMDPHRAKLDAREKELRHRYGIACQQVEAGTQEVRQLQGAISLNDYSRRTWVMDRDCVDVLDAVFPDASIVPELPARKSKQPKGA
jgi:hypothetical protein